MQSLLDGVRAFRASLERQIHELVLFGEVRDLKLDGAIGRLAGLAYVDAALVRAEIVAAEGFVHVRRWRDAAAASRRAVEQLIDDAYREAVKRNVAQPGLTARQAQANALGGAFVDHATSRQAYATFSILSGLGSHAGAPLSDEEGDQAWLAARLAIALLGSKLPQ